MLDRVAGQNELILLGLGDLDVDTLLHHDPAHNLLADEVADLDLVQTRVGLLVQVDVDGEMGVDVAHLVLEALGHADDQVVDDSADGAEGGDILAVAVVDLNRDGVLLGLAEDDCQVAEVLDELPCFPFMSEILFPSCAHHASLPPSPRFGVWVRPVSYLGDPRR